MNLTDYNDFGVIAFYLIVFFVFLFLFDIFCNCFSEFGRWIKIKIVRLWIKIRRKRK
jgi:hypothetical protein